MRQSILAPVILLASMPSSSPAQDSAAVLTAAFVSAVNNLPIAIELDAHSKRYTSRFSATSAAPCRVTVFDTTSIFSTFQHRSFGATYIGYELNFGESQNQAVIRQDKAMLLFGVMNPAMIDAHSKTPVWMVTMNSLNNSFWIIETWNNVDYSGKPDSAPAERKDGFTLTVPSASRGQQLGRLAERLGRTCAGQRR